MRVKLPSNIKIPTSRDFAPQAIKNALLRYANNHWIFRYSIPLFLGSILFSVLFGFSYFKFLLILSIFGIGLSSWIINFFVRSDKFKISYVEQLNNLIKEHTEQKLKELRENLKKHKDNQAARQLEQFIKKIEILIDILKHKFDEDSLTFQRYYGIAQEVYLSGIDNLSDILMAHKTIESIDLNYINDRINAIGAKNQTGNAVKKELDALHRSLESHKEQEIKIQDLIAENEMALSQMDETTISISEISKSKDRQAQIDMENSMKALSELKERSKYYSR